MMSDFNPADEIHEVVRRYREFTECVVGAVQWSRSGTQLEVNVDYVWKEDGSLRSDREDRLLVRLQFGRVQELEVKNQMNSTQLARPELIGWGMSEISLLVIQETIRSRAYSDEKHRFYEATFRRENGAWISIVFADFDSTEISVDDRGSM